MTATYIEDYLSISASLTAAAVARLGLRAPLYIAQETATPISNDLTSVASATDVADLLAASQISAQAAEDLAAYFLQARPPSIVYVATYDHDAGSPETPDDALDRAEVAGTVFGVISQESRLDADLEAVANWCLARPYRYAAVLQSDDAGLLTSGKPAGLADCELPYVWVCYSADGEPTATGFAGVLGGANLATQGTKLTAKLAMASYVQGAALPVITNAQRAFALANDVSLLQQAGAGVLSGATKRIQAQKLTYGGASGTSVVSHLYLIDNVEAAMAAAVDASATLGEPILTDTGGLGRVKQYVDAALDVMFRAGHFRVGTDANGVPLASGFRSVVTATGSVISVAVTVLYALEATANNVTINGEVA